MTITEALGFNKKISRDCWPDDRFITENNLGYFVEGDSVYHLSVYDIKAIDWFPRKEEKEKEEEFLDKKFQIGSKLESIIEMEPIMRLSIKCKFCGNVQDETFSIKKELKDYYDTQ